ncbi:MAG: beta-glucosidase [Hydrogenibacillus sp.]|nr:beta-glucosidase [Hydrogenibacillus sp.]
MTTFPKHFLWGVATAAYQIEGAVREDGRGPSIWDVFSHTPGRILGGDTGDVACDHYHRYEEDLDWMSQLGINAYRFSIAWPRIFPEGSGRLNETGIDFYARLLEGLHARGITPVVTLYHWDLPYALEEKGGWTNRDTAHYFAEYAHTLFRRLGDRVPYWITLNEPWVVTFLGYVTGEHAPGKQDIGAAVRVAHHLNLAHAEAVEALRDERSPETAKIGITNILTKAIPAGDSIEERFSAYLYERLQNGIFLDPIFFGRYPDELRAILMRAPEAQAFFEREAPRIEDDLKRMRQTVDFLGVNYYFPARIRHNPDSPWGGIDFADGGAGERTAMGWEVYPEGLYDILRDLHARYAPPSILITENGAAYDDVITPDGKVHDTTRIRYIERHLERIAQAIADGVPVDGYFYWSFMDNFEWAYGYSKRFGLIYIDYATQKRLPKDSFYAYHALIRRHREG